MDNETREKIKEIVLSREQLRPLKRLPRLLKDPIRTIPYYLLASVSHIKPFQLTFKTMWGTKMTSFLPEGNTFLYYGFCEANVTNFLLNYLHDGQTFIDIGAHVGIYTLLSSKLIGENGEVHSFEPTQRTYKLLEKNASQLNNVYLNNLAVHSSVGTITLTDFGPGFGAYNTAHQSGNKALSKKSVTVRVNTTTLDTYTEKHNLKPDLVKIDAEGVEEKILAGSSVLLKAHRPLIIIEVANEDLWAENRSNSFETLQTNNYLPYQINQDGTITPHHLQKNYLYDNLLFVPQEKTETLKHLTI